MSGTLRALVPLVRAAGDLALAARRRGLRVDYKGPGDPVTQADRAANSLICDALRSQFPGVAIVAEESEPEAYSQFAASERIFFVDPIDGTREYVAQRNEFCVMIGLVEGDRATLGAIHSPTTGATWLGELGRGALAIDAAGSETTIAVSRCDRLEDLHLVASRSPRDSSGRGAIDRLGARSVTEVGSAGLKGVEVAIARADAYVAPRYAGKRWDACAVDALVTAAGGCVSDAGGEPLSYRASDLVNRTGVVASNGRLHRELIARLRDTPRGS